MLDGWCYFSVTLTDQYVLQIGKTKMFSVSHKTVFVVDHCPYMAESSRQQVECDVLTKSRAQGVIPLAPVSKSLWTCAVECSMEYCRILYDIYPRDKLVSFLIFVFVFFFYSDWNVLAQAVSPPPVSLAVWIWTCWKIQLRSQGEILRMSICLESFNHMFRNFYPMY